MNRVNRWLAVKITNGVGTMWCAYIFAALALWGLPSALAPGGMGLVAWAAQQFLQLTLLSILAVGQQVQNEAAQSHHAAIRGVHERLDRHEGHLAHIKRNLTTPARGATPKETP